MSTELDVILYQRIPTPRSPPKILLNEAWRVQRDEPIAEQEKEEQEGFTNWRIILRVNPEQVRWLQISKGLQHSTHSAKSPREPSTTWERSRRNAHPGPNIGKEESCQKQKRMTKEQFDLLTIPFYIKKMGASRGAKHGKSQEPCDNFKAK